jgi:hypothetical protein
LHRHTDQTGIRALKSLEAKRTWLRDDFFTCKEKGCAIGEEKESEAPIYEMCRTWKHPEGEQQQDNKDIQESGNFKLRSINGKRSNEQTEEQ